MVPVFLADCPIIPKVNAAFVQSLVIHEIDQTAAIKVNQLQWIAGERIDRHRIEMGGHQIVKPLGQ